MESDIKRVTVGRRLGDVVRRDDAARPGLVLDDDGLLDLLAELLAEVAGQDVGHAAGWGRHDDADGLGWILLPNPRGGGRNQGE